MTARSPKGQSPKSASLMTNSGHPCWDAQSIAARTSWRKSSRPANRPDGKLSALKESSFTQYLPFVQ